MAEPASDKATVERRQSNASKKPSIDNSISRCTSPIVDAMLTDFYQLTMCYAYFKSGKHDEIAVFDAFFRKCPFNGEYCLVAGIDEVLRFVNAFGFTKSQIDYIRSQIPSAEEEFFTYLGKLDCSRVRITAMKEGDVAFAREPIMTFEGPLAVCQLLETTVLNLLNYPCLVATCAARHRRAASDIAYTIREQEVRSSIAGLGYPSMVDLEGGAPLTGPPDSPLLLPPSKERPILLEFGCRRAQGPDGALTGSRYSYLGGFDGSSHTQAGYLFDIPVTGTHAHAFVVSFHGLEDLSQHPQQSRKLGKLDDFVARVLEYRAEVPGAQASHDGELVAFIRYAQSFPEKLLVLVDTYDTLMSGVPNFLCVSLALDDAGYTPVGVRLDSGDLAYLSRQVRMVFDSTAEKYPERSCLRSLKIAASNDINESVLNSLNEQGHSIDIFGIGTNLITCQSQPALGMVYKLVELEGQPRIKLSEEMEKVSIPAKKQIYRLYSKDGVPILDLMQKATDEPPQANHKIFCRHILDDTKRCYVVPSRVEPLLHLIWDGKPTCRLPTLHESRDFCLTRVLELRPDHLRPVNPTPYKVSVSNSFYNFFRNIWHESAPVREFC